MKLGRPTIGGDTQPAEASLVQRAKSGDAAAFGRLYDASVDRIYRYVFFRVTDTELAEDLTAEVFLRAWENLHRYQPGGPFVAWLYTIARNTVIDHYRTRRPNIPLDQAIVKLESGLDERVDLKQDVEMLKQAMEQLTEEQREVLTLRFIADQDTGHIAKRMRRSEGAIRALQMRALQSLARIMRTDRRQDL